MLERARMELSYWRRRRWEAAQDFYDAQELGQQNTPEAELVCDMYKEADKMCDMYEARIKGIEELLKQTEWAVGQ